MKYALGNMLNGAGGLNADQLALDLQFAADKTLTARKGPTPVLTRGSSATLVNSAGLIQYASENLLLQSENFASITWSKTGGGFSSVANIEPDGSPNSELFTEDTLSSTHRTFQSFTGVSGTVYTLSVFLKFAGRQYVYLENRSITGNPYVVFDIQNGTVFSTVGSLTSTIQAYPNGWYRCSVNGTANLAGGNYVIGGFSGGSQSYIGSGGPAFYAWGAQIEVGPLKSYNPTTTAAFYGPRFDHDPVTLVCRGLLIEEGRTNLFTQSETWQTGANFTGPTAPTVTNDTTTSPDGLLTADTLSGSTGTAIDGSVTSTWRQPNISSATAYTFSIYVRSLGVATKAEIRIRDNSTGASVQTLDTSLTSSWKRLSVTATTGATTTSIRCIIQNTDGPIAIWGAQLEAGSFATSYIPTTTSALARSADVCSITGASSTFGNTDGTLLTIGASLFISTTINNNICSIESGTTGQLRIFTRAAQAGRLSAMVSNVILTPSSGYNTAGVFYKAAIAANSSGADYVIDGTQIPDTYTGSSITADNLKITGVPGSTTNSWISSIRYYKKRLPVSKLQALTA